MGAVPVAQAESSKPILRHAPGSGADASARPRKYFQEDPVEICRTSSERIGGAKIATKREAAPSLKELVIRPCLREPARKPPDPDILPGPLVGHELEAARV